MAQAQPERGASRDDIRDAVLQALQDHDLTWTQGQIDAAVDALATGAGHPALVLPRILGQTAMRLWKLRRAVADAGSATDTDSPSE
jgi:hypothetical protein